MDEMIIRDRIIEYTFILQKRAIVYWNRIFLYIFKNKIPFSFRLKLIDDGDGQSYMKDKK